MNTSQRMYSVSLASEHKQGLHEERSHPMCRQCHREEAELLDRASVSDD